MIGDVPSYVFDEHTATGKAAIHRLARENPAVRGALGAYVPEYRALDAACVTTFHVDAAPVCRRFELAGSAELERLWVETDTATVDAAALGAVNCTTELNRAAQSDPTNIRREELNVGTTFSERPESTTSSDHRGLPGRRSQLGTSAPLRAITGSPRDFMVSATRGSTKRPTIPNTLLHVAQHYRLRRQHSVMRLKRTLTLRDG